MSGRDEEDRLALATALEAVTAAMIHDLSQPLAAIVTSGEACLRWLTRPEPGIADARAAADRIVDTAMAAGEKLASYRRSARSNTMVVDLASLAHEARAELGAEGDGIALNASEAVAAEGDPALLKAALQHLIRNASEAIARSGRSGEIAITVARGEHGEALIRVADSGPGLPEDRARLFKPFFSTVPGRIGLGLAIARTIAERHGGRIRAIEVESGATFEIALPALDA